MTSHFLFTPNLSHAFNGSYKQCLQLAKELTGKGNHELLKIARARAGEDYAIIIFDVTADFPKQTKGVRGIPRKKLQKVCRRSPLLIEEHA